ncbi:LysR family transcriptional regulator [Streptomyces daliensis]|uniref:LysR family transcriptional regulator n=1 Tax=Streptomyces daliensis TaxID=299421 RepID=A0A8T4ILC3_9ACTN|nr:LysR family transcriptional regulator [Streptomyces daliensis]
MIDLASLDNAQITPSSDLRLLVALDALLQTGSVTEAAKRLQLSPSAMSRTLHRIRHTLGDPILARAGRGMVVTPKGVELRERVHVLVREAQVLLSAGDEEDVLSVGRNFALIVDDGYAGVLAPHLASPGRAQAFHFLSEGQGDGKALSEGTADLKIGRIYSSSPELHVENLAYSRFVGVAALGHDFLHDSVDVERFAHASHIDILRNDGVASTVEAALAEHDLRRAVVVTTPQYTSALSMIGRTDLVAVVPEILVGSGSLMAGLGSFELPVPIAPLAIRMAWHPRSDSDPAHTWLRSRIRDVLKSGIGPSARCPEPPQQQGRHGQRQPEEAGAGPARGVVYEGG